MSDDSHDFCPSQLCITEFLLGYQSKIRIKSEVGTVKHVEALQFFVFLFTGKDFVDRLLNVKNLVFVPYCGVRACMCVCVWGGQDVITLQTSTMMTPQSATVSRVSTARGVGGWGSGYKCILLSQRVLVYACAKYRWK